MSGGAKPLDETDAVPASEVTRQQKSASGSIKSYMQYYL
jgi:hypothetical protein